MRVCGRIAYQHLVEKTAHLLRAILGLWVCRFRKQRQELLRLCAYACVCMCGRMRARACVHACVRACVRARAWARVRVHACMHACVHACNSPSPLTSIIEKKHLARSCIVPLSARENTRNSARTEMFCGMERSSALASSKSRLINSVSFMPNIERHICENSPADSI